MRYFSQKHRDWANMTLGESGKTMAKVGCYVTSICMLVERSPDLVLPVLNEAECFTDEGALLNEKAAQVLNMIYSKIYSNPGKKCICETDHFKSKGSPQHFFMWMNQGQFICDPLDGIIKHNKYNIVSYRCWDRRSA